MLCYCVLSWKKWVRHAISNTWVAALCLLAHRNPTCHSSRCCFAWSAPATQKSHSSCCMVYAAAFPINHFFLGLVTWNNPYFQHEIVLNLSISLRIPTLLNPLISILKCWVFITQRLKCNFFIFFLNSWRTVAFRNYRFLTFWSLMMIVSCDCLLKTKWSNYFTDAESNRMVIEEFSSLQIQNVWLEILRYEQNRSVFKSILSNVVFVLELTSEQKALKVVWMF